MISREYSENLIGESLSYCLHTLKIEDDGPKALHTAHGYGLTVSVKCTTVVHRRIMVSCKVNESPQPRRTYVPFVRALRFLLLLLAR